MNKVNNKKRFLLLAGLICLALSVAVAVLLFSRRYDYLWTWYTEIRKTLIRLEDYIMGLNKSWEFIGVIMVLYVIKSIFPIYFTSTLCLISGMVLPIWIAIPVNIVGVALQFTIKYFWGRRFGAGYTWKILSKNDTLRHAIQLNGKGNTWLLFAIRLVPCTPVNMISSVYGSLDFGFRKFILISLAGFFPKIIIFTYTGTNMFDPLSPGCLVPIMLVSFLTGITLLSANGGWTVVENIMKLYNRSQKKKALRSGAVTPPADTADTKDGDPDDKDDEEGE